MRGSPWQARAAEIAAGRLKLAIVPLLLAAAWLRFATLDQRPLWYDEAFTVKAVESAGSVPRLLQIVDADDQQHPPGHYLLVYALLRIFPTNNLPWLVRAPSALCGVLTVYLAFALASRVFDRLGGLAAALACAFSIYHIDSSQDARPYALLLALTTAQVLFFVLGLEKTGWLRLLGFISCGVLAMYTHRTALFVQIALALTVIGRMVSSVIRRHRLGDSSPQTMRTELALLAGLGVCVLAYAPQIGPSLSFLGQPAILGREHVLNPSVRFMSELAARWGAGGGWALLPFLLPCLAGVIEAVRRGRHHVLVVLLLVLPTAAFSLAPFSKFFDIRFLMTSLPAYFVLIGGGISALARWCSAGSEAFGDRSRHTGRQLIPVAALAVIAVLDLRAYITFRTTTYRCSQFFADPVLLDLNDGFCRKHLILNSLVEDQRFILRDLDARAE